MSEQRQYNRDDIRLRVQGDDPETSVERLAETRAQLDRIYAATDAILDGILTTSDRFLEQVRQSGGE